MKLSREEYQVLFENVPAFIAVVDQNYIIVQANQNFKNTFGGEVGIPCYQAYKGLEEKCPVCLVEKTFGERKPQVNEEWGRTKEGGAIPYLVYTAPIFGKKGKIPYVIEMSVDLREKKRLEEELRASQEFLNNLIENSIDGIIAINASGKVIVFNRSAEQILGYQASEVLGSQKLEKFFPRSFSKKISEALAGKEEESLLQWVPQETHLRSRGGERIPVRFSGRMLRQENSPVGAVGFFQDQRPLKGLEREKLQAERLAAVGQTLAGLAHGIKNMITGLEGGVFAIKKGEREEDHSCQQKGLEMIERNVEKISTLVKDLLSYSKKRVPELEWIRPNDLLEEVCTLFREKARQSQIQLALETDPKLGVAFLEPKGIDICLTNLLSNAIDACLADPKKEHHQIFLRTRKHEDESLSFEVADNGIGMTEEVRKKLFTCFFSTKGAGGTGLGLFVTQKIIQEMGGSISVETNPGQGSRFCINLPQEEYPTPPDDEVTSPQSYQLGA
ncbi:MAG: PAS domain S-box protein [Deltaproteobacteria bacterium]|nr:PAS domain S-box protein [Deltaproteobacteria bacterium]